MKIGLIGTGIMGSAVLRVVGDCVEEGKEEVSFFFSSRTLEKAEELAEELGGTVLDNVTLATDCDMIFLGVKPQVLPQVLEEIRPKLVERKGKGSLVTLVSMAAGVTIASILEGVAQSASVIRMMPNTPLLVGEGVILYCASEEESPHLEAFERWMSEGGILDLLPETLMDAGSALSGCGPAFCAMFLESLADGAVSCGLPRAQALAYAAQTLIGTGALCLEEGLHPAGIKDGVCSPGGATIMGVTALEERGLRGAGIMAVEAAFKKTKELGQS